MTVSATATNTRLSYSILIMLCNMPTLSFYSKTAHQDQEDGWNERNYNDKEWKIIGANNLGVLLITTQERFVRKIEQQ